MYTFFRKKSRFNRRVNIPLMIDASKEFIAMCLEYLDYIRMIELPDFMNDECIQHDKDIQPEEPIREPSLEHGENIDENCAKKYTTGTSRGITNEIKKTIALLEEKGENVPFIIKEIVSKLTNDAETTEETT